MSFSSETKNELALIIPEKRCCMLAQIAGFVRTCGTVKLGRGMSVKLVTENAAAARTFIKILKQYFSIEEELEISREQMMKNHMLYEVTIAPQMNAEQILREIGILKVQQGLNYFSQTIPEDIVKSKCCKKAAIRGLFLGAGSVSDPEKGYHFEIVSNSQELGESIKKIFNTFDDINAKLTTRKKNYVVYIKESEQIVDIFNIMGAHGRLLDLENIRIRKEMRNRTNRLVNCETANLDKTVNASGTQVEAIEKIIKLRGWSFLTDKLREVAEIRLSNPEASLSELVELMGGKVGKSGVNHRLKKIEEMAAKL